MQPTDLPDPSQAGLIQLRLECIHELHPDECSICKKGVGTSRFGWRRPEQSDVGPKVRARFPGACIVCDEMIETDDWIQMWEGRAVHVECVD